MNPLEEAILRELLRGGQVYFLHNEVDTIERTAENIRELVLRPGWRLLMAKCGNVNWSR